MKAKRHTSDMKTIQQLSSSSQNRENFFIEENFKSVKLAKKMHHSPQGNLAKHVANAEHIEKNYYPQLKDKEFCLQHFVFQTLLT